MTALFDTSVLLDYLLGVKRAAHVLEPYEHRAISVITWVELISAAPAAQREATRAFLRSFERFSTSESIADAALILIDERPGLSYHRALTWATARVNQAVYVTLERQHLRPGEPGVVVPYTLTAKVTP